MEKVDEDIQNLVGEAGTALLSEYPITLKFDKANEDHPEGI